MATETLTVCAPFDGLIRKFNIPKGMEGVNSSKLTYASEKVKTHWRKDGIGNFVLYIPVVTSGPLCRTNAWVRELRCIFVHHHSFLPDIMVDMKFNRVSDLIVLAGHDTCNLKIADLDQLLTGTRLKFQWRKHDQDGNTIGIDLTRWFDMKRDSGPRVRKAFG